jgi:Asp-tRNA(Asn)/Glu-tRNA(Gln) amidotransferase A subunit family amidase
MVPAAIGTQVGGSIIRPAAYCGNVALKPSQGGINRGERQATSMSTHGVHAGSIEDMWQVAFEIASRCGGDRGGPGLTGPSAPPAAAKPDRLIVLETEGWGGLDAKSRSAFESLLENLRRVGVTLLPAAIIPGSRRSRQAVGERARAVQRDHVLGESLVPAQPDRRASRGRQLRAKAVVARAEAMTPVEYRGATGRARSGAAAPYAVAPLADAIVTLACPGPAPLWPGDVPGEPLAPRPTGDFVFNAPSSMLFAPAVTVPLMAVDGMPVGVQVMGQRQQDARVTALARWLLANVPAVVVR